MSITVKKTGLKLIAIAGLTLVDRGLHAKRRSTPLARLDLVRPSDRAAAGIYPARCAGAGLGVSVGRHSRAPCRTL